MWSARSCARRPSAAGKTAEGSMRPRHSRASEPFSTMPVMQGSTHGSTCSRTWPARPRNGLCCNHQAGATLSSTIARLSTPPSPISRRAVRSAASCCEAPKSRSASSFTASAWSPNLTGERKRKQRTQAARSCVLTRKPQVMNENMFNATDSTKAISWFGSSSALKFVICEPHSCIKLHRSIPLAKPAASTRIPDSSVTGAQKRLAAATFNTNSHKAIGK
mmetsp:Transcript_21709/g.58069  ORF Transcript_21709/g.58069 Transcript_21709/m.58069 type:complete len:220 (-) Transcript_21709:704-1363(-)